MIKSQSKAIKAKQNKKVYSLTFFQVLIINQLLSDQCYLVVKSTFSKQTWRSDLFQIKMERTWSIQVDSSSVQLALFMKIKEKFIVISNKKINQGFQTITLSQDGKQTNKTCLIRYQFKEVKKLAQKQSGNFFAHDSNIFDSFINGNQISRVQFANSTNTKAHQLSYQKLRFDGQSYIHSAPSMIDQQSQNEDNQQNKIKEISDERQKISNYSLKDSIQSNYNPPHLKVYNRQNQKERPSNQYNQNLNTSLNDSRSDIKQIIKIIQPKKQFKNQEKQIKNLSKVQQKDQIEKDMQSKYFSTAEKWYRNRFNKKNLKQKRKNIIQDPKKTQQKNKLNPKAIEVTAYNTQLIQRQQNQRQITDISVQQPLKLKTIDFSLSDDEGSKKLYSLSRNDGKQSSLWYTNITLPSQGTILVQCQTEDRGLNGCLGSQQMKKCACPLYDQQGKINGNLNFKWKSISNFVVQTADISLAKQQSKQQLLNSAQQKQIKPQGQNLNSEENKKQEQHLERNNTPQSLQNKNSGLLENPEYNLQNQNNNKKLNIQQIQSNDQKKYKGSPIDSLRSWRKGRYTDSPQIQEQSNSLQQSSFQKKQKQINQMQNLLRTLSPQAKKAMQKQYQESRMKQIKQKMCKISTLDLKIQNNHSFASSVSGPIVQRTNFDQRQSQKQPLQVNSNRIKLYNDNMNDIDYSNISQGQNVSHHSFTYRLDKMKQDFFENTTDRQKNYSFPLHSSNYQKEQDNENNEQINQQLIQDQDMRRKNQSQFRKKKSRKNQKLINIKICSIQLRLETPTYYGKLLQMRIGDNKFLTQTNKGICLLDWKGNGYLFLRVSQYSILFIDFIEQRPEGKALVGQCKIHIPFISSNKPNIIFQHHDFIRNEHQVSLGRLNINFQLIERRVKSLQGKIFNSQRLTQDLENHNKRNDISQNKKRKNINSTRVSTQNAKNNYENRIIPINLGNKQYSIGQSVFSGLKCKPPLTKRKYTGGNIRIPRASRFKQDKQQKVDKFPGPGSYNVESSFDRHAREQ